MTVQYTKPSADALADAYGYQVQSFSSSKMVANNVPVYRSAELGADGETLTLTYDEVLDSASVPGQAAFSVKVNTAVRDLAVTGPVDVTGRTVVLTLATAVREGETVTVSYTKPGTHPVQDSDGNAAANLTDAEVTNASTLNATGKPSIVGVRRVGETLTATKGTLADPQGLTKADNGDSGYGYTYQWLRVDGSTETVLSSATSSTYTLAPADEGETVKGEGVV